MSLTYDFYYIRMGSDETSIGQIFKDQQPEGGKIGMQL